MTPRLLQVPLDDEMVKRVQYRILVDRNRHRELHKVVGKDEEEYDDDDGNDCERNIKIRTDYNVKDEKEIKEVEQEEILDILSSGRIKLVVGFHPDQATEPCIDLAMLLGVPFCVVPCCVFPSEFPDRRLRLSPSVMQQQMQRSDGDDRNGNDDDYKQEEQLVPVRNYNQFLDYLRQKPTTITQSSIISSSSSSSSSSPGDDEAHITTIDSNSTNIIHTAYLNFPFTETAKNVVLYTLPPLPPTGDGSK